jgi:hypothetical protein
MLALFFLLAGAQAQDAVTMQIHSTGQIGGEVPALVLVPLKDATSLAVSLDCGGTRASRSGRAPSGQPIEIPLRVAAGTWTCRGSLRGAFTDGSTGDMPLEFQVSMLAPMKVEVPAESVDLAARRLSVVSSRPIARIDVAVTGLGKQHLGGGSTDVAPGRTSPVQVTWTQTPGEAILIVVTVTDPSGFWSELTLRPWHYAIPHTDVSFETDDSVVRPSEEPKLAEVLTHIQGVYDKYGRDVPVINLYVAGYTDTVGTAEHNEQLSRLRAASLAKWFRAHGFSSEVWYEGFGERVLAVQTPDGTDEALNRRAAYVLGSEPPVGAQFPAAGWKRVE